MDLDGSKKRLTVISTRHGVLCLLRSIDCAEGTMAPVANNPRQGPRLAVTIMYGDRPVPQALPLVIPSNMGVWLRGKGEQNRYVGGSSLVCGPYSSFGG